VAVAPGNTLDRALRRAARGGLVALLAACGGDAGPTTPAEAAPDVTLQSAEPAAPTPEPPGSRADTGTDPGQLSVSIPAPVTPAQPPEEPAPLPSAELELPRPDLPAPAEVVVPPNDCRFEYLGEWVRCENAGWPNTIETDAPDLVTCMQECLERDDCTAVTDYLWLGLHDGQSQLGCWLYVSTCDAPAFAADWGEEDAGRDYRRSSCAQSVER
jgi:hypothetical protein